VSYPNHITATATQAALIPIENFQISVPGVESLQALNLANVPSLGQEPSEA